MEYDYDFEKEDKKEEKKKEKGFWFFKKKDKEVIKKEQNEWRLESAKETLHYLRLMKKDGSMFQPEIRKSIDTAIKIIDTYKSKIEIDKDGIIIITDLTKRK